MTAVVALAVLVPFLVFSDTFMLLVFSGGLTVIAVFEILSCVGLIKNMFVSVPAFAVSVAAVIMTRSVEGTERYFALLLIIFFTFFVYIMTVSVFSHGTVPISDAAVFCIYSICIIFGFCSIVLLRDLKYGKYIWLLAFLAPWISDSCAYFIGVNFGKHKLISDVSPKKTVEGAVGGIIFGTASVVLYGFIVSNIISADANYPSLLFAGFVMSVLSQCGDLAASLIKRHYNIKDYGKVFPGHGGVLDRFDSIILTSPFLYFLFMLSELFELFF